MSPTGFLRISPNVGKSLKLIKNKLNFQATKGCQPVLGRELGRKKQGDRKIEDSRPRSVLTLRGSGSQSHPWLTPIPGRSSDAPHGKDAGSRSRCDSAQRARKPTAVPDREREVQRSAPARTRGALSSGRRARAQAFTCFIFPSLEAARRGQRSPPPSLLLHRQVFTGVLKSFIRSFPRRPKYIDSEHGVVLLHSTGVFTARAECWG